MSRIFNRSNSSGNMNVFKSKYGIGNTDYN